MTLDLFAPKPTKAEPLAWTQLYISTLGVTYRWALIPGTPTTDGPPEGFCLEYHTPDGWADVRNARRRERVWRHLVETGEVER